MQKLILWSHRHPKTIVIFILAITLFFSLGLKKLRIDASSSGMMLQHDPSMAYYNDTVEKFGTENITVVFIKDKDLFTPEKLLRLDDIQYALESLPAVQKTESLFTVTNFKGENGSLNVLPLMDYLPETLEEAARVKADALNNPIWVNNIISPDGNAVALNLFVTPDPDDPDFVLHFTDKVEEIIGKARPDFEKVFQLGNSYTRKSITECIISDQMTMAPLSVIVLLLMLLVTMRTSAGAVLPMLTAGSSVVWSAGFMGYMGIPLNILTVIVPSLIIVIGSTEDIHLLAKYFEGLKAEGGSKLKAVDFMAAKTSTAVMLTALTTFLGFLSITINDILILKQFGIVSSFGLFVNPLITCLVTPVYLKFFGPGLKHPEKGKANLNSRLLAALSNRIILLVQTQKKLILGFSLTLSIIMGLFIFDVKVDNDLLGYFKPDSPIRMRSQMLHEEIAGPQAFYIRVSSGVKGYFKEPENLAQVAGLVSYMQEKNWFDKVISLTEFLKLIHKEMNNGDPVFFKLPTSKKLIAQYLLTLQRDEIERYVSPDYSEVNLMVRHIKGSSHELNEAVSDVKTYMAAHLNPHLKTGFTGENILVNNAADSIAYGQVWSLTLLLFIIFVIMSVLFVNIKAGLLSLVPNFFPIILVFGVMGIFKISLNVGTAMVAAIAIGIAVDDTVHLMTHYNRDMRKLQDQDKAMESCIRSEITPVISTSTALAMGFAVICFSSFKPIVSFGFLSALVMIFACFGDLLLTPVLLSSTQLITIWDMVKLNLRQEVIEGSRLLRGLKPWQMKRVILLGKVWETPQGERIIRYGEHGNTMFMVLEGSAEVLTRDANDAPCVIGSVRPGDIFGEMALVNPGPRTADIKATEDMKCLEFDWKGMSRLRTIYPRIAAHLYRNIAKILGQRLNERTIDLMKVTK
ncbi:MMPL family transporter [Desulfospira joergensenii]|uniref:MMPL family transporter n=1 Tax=Desulfospira joergensenii TaxID=53329 RepID=UPI0003B77D6C|nr:MMPL family transporter [Desulfospira joergensenii]